MADHQLVVVHVSPSPMDGETVENTSTAHRSFISRYPAKSTI